MNKGSLVSNSWHSNIFCGHHCSWLYITAGQQEHLSPLVLGHWPNPIQLSSSGATTLQPRVREHVSIPWEGPSDSLSTTKGSAHPTGTAAPPLENWIGLDPVTCWLSEKWHYITLSVCRWCHIDDIISHCQYAIRWILRKTVGSSFRES